MNLQDILNKHRLWVYGEEGGERANLRGADLSYANLSYADLTGAALTGADLRGADLSYANLSYADLTGANLTGVDLRGADLRYANLSYADLRGANLDFSCWSLSCQSTSVKGDKYTVGQLLWHALEHAKSSGIAITSLEQLKELANNSSPVTKHDKETV